MLQVQHLNINSSALRFATEFLVGRDSVEPRNS